jgi:anti-sigma factor RsiW
MHEMTCRQGVDFLIDYLEGTLPAESRALVDAHVAGCPRCVAFIRSYGDTPRLLRDATTQRLPADARESLQAFLRAERRRARD